MIFDVFLSLAFTLYLLFLTLTVLALGINYYRIRDSSKINPQMIVFLIPFVFNFILAKSVFWDINPLFTTLLPCLLIFFVGRRLKNVRVFGLTGGIATGKSTLGRQMRKTLPKLVVIDCDEITTQLRQKGRSGYKLILSMLGQEKQKQFLEPGTQQIKRERLSAYVFQNPQFRKELTARMGKLIMWEIVKGIFKNIAGNQNLIMIDAPILYETKVLEHVCYPVIVVGCSEEEQIRRLQKRNKYSRDQAISRIKSQMPLQAKEKKCQIYVKNDGSEDDLLNRTLAKLNKYLAKKE